MKYMLERARTDIDHDAVARGDPGLTHSFAVGLVIANDCAGVVVDPVWLMETSGLAFRIWIEARLFSMP